MNCSSQDQIQSKSAGKVEENKQLIPDLSAVANLSHVPMPGEISSSWQS